MSDSLRESLLDAHRPGHGMLIAVTIVGAERKNAL
jgi:hypothetical protein